MELQLYPDTINSPRFGRFALNLDRQKNVCLLFLSFVAIWLVFVLPLAALAITVTIIGGAMSDIGRSVGAIVGSTVALTAAVTLKTMVDRERMRRRARLYDRVAFCERTLIESIGRDMERIISNGKHSGEEAG